MNQDNEQPAPQGSPAPGEERKPERRIPWGIIKTGATVVAGILILYLVLVEGIWYWGLSRVYVAPGEMLVLTAKFGDKNENPEENRVVEEGVKGVQKRVYGEGRHFFNPIAYERMMDDKVIEIPPGKIGLVESQSGKSLPDGEFLADEGYKGIRRKVLTPGKWRLNPIAFKVSELGATIIEPGFVGCVTSLSGIPSPKGELAKKGQRGILADVLQPGIYYLNPREYQVDRVEIGYRQIGMKNVEFPSKDGFTIRLDISVVWGLEPQNVPKVINAFGNIGEVVTKVIEPQVQSICRIEGSKYGAKDFIEGKTREEFQDAFTKQLEIICYEKDITVIIGLVREINVPAEVRSPIQKGKIAVEEKLTKEEQKTTQTIKNELEELKADVRKGVQEVEAETEKVVAETRADGEKQVAKIAAETEVSVAQIMLEAAKYDAQKERVLGKAQADVEELKQKAQADALHQNIAALGSPEDYARYIFAQNLPEDIKIYLRYAGEGTLWTDLPEGAKDMEKLAALKILEEKAREKKKEGR